MKNYSKYIMLRVLGPLAFIALGFTGLAWLTQSLRFVDLIINRGLNVGMFVYLSSLLLPSMLAIILPVSLFAAVMFAFNRMSADSEMIILSNAGLSRWQILRPLVHLALIVMFLGYSVAFYVMPASYRKFKDMQSFIRDNYASVLLQEGVFNTMVEGLTVYIRSREPSGQLNGILVHDNRNPKSPVTMMAESGQLLNTPSGPQFLLINGNRQEMNFAQRQVSILHFDRYAVELSMFQNPVTKRVREAEERYLPELLFPGSDVTPALHARLRAELHQRLLWSFSSLFSVLLAAACFMGSFNRRNQWRKLLFVSVCCAGYFGTLLALINSLSNQGALVALVYIYVLAALWLALRAVHGKLYVPPFLKRIVAT